MKRSITISLNETEKLEWLYVPDCEYHDYGHCKRHLQIVFPYRREMVSEDKYPLILFIPGSAWHKQEMYNDIPKLTTLAQRGFVVAAMEYRESDIATFPAQVEDVCNALKFIPTISDSFHIDTERIYLMGNSSGGHIALMSVLLNAHGVFEQMPPILGVISECGSLDLLECAKQSLAPWMTVRPSAVLLGVDEIEGNEELAMKASCVTYVTEDVEIPPVLLIHSEYDPIVSVENSRLLYKKLAETEHNVAYYEIAGDAAHCGATYFSNQILDIVERFCNEHKHK